jgi:hypothetical protein
MKCSNCSVESKDFFQCLKCKSIFCYECLGQWSCYYCGGSAKYLLFLLKDSMNERK